MSHTFVLLDPSFLGTRQRKTSGKWVSYPSGFSESFPESVPVSLIRTFSGESTIRKGGRRVVFSTESVSTSFFLLNAKFSGHPDREEWNVVLPRTLFFDGNEPPFLILDSKLMIAITMSRTGDLG